MKTVYLIIGVILAAGALLALFFWGRPPSVSEATVDFCADVNQYAHALLDLRAIDENSTVDELQAAGAAVGNSLEAVRSSAADVRDARIAALEDSQEDLQATIQSIPSDVTLAEARAALRLATLNALADTVDVMTTTCEVSLTEGATSRDQR